MQAVRLGDTLLASCACEPQADLIRALETRTDKAQNNRWDGFDYASAGGRRRGLARAQGPALLRRRSAARAAPTHGTDRRSAAYHGRQGRLREDAGPDPQPGGRLERHRERADREQRADRPSRHQGQLHQARAVRALRLRRHRRARPHRRLQRLHRELPRVHGARLLPQGAHVLRPAHGRLHGHPPDGAGGEPARAARAIPADATDALALVDEQRQDAEALALGRLASFYLDTWSSQLPDSAGPAAPVAQPRSITRFDAATFRWVGGDNFTDNPDVVVQRRSPEGPG